VPLELADPIKDGDRPVHRPQVPARGPAPDGGQEVFIPAQLERLDLFGVVDREFVEPLHHPLVCAKGC
jgi:hypothetical protein